MSEADRLPPLAPEALSAAQRSAAEELAAGRRGALFGPFIPLLRSPELLSRAQRLGEYLRYESALPARLRELAILVTAQHYRQAYEWHVHAPLAAAAGISAPLIAAIGRGERPERLDAAEAEIHDFCRELHRAHRVSDARYAAVQARHGEMGLIDLVGICGYYGLLALVLNVARTPLPEGASPPPWLG
ncbi:MAG TPA: carboxymuconolactone decarboxylase family protein [Steroidobacteraceae bacterium]|nr:carboxymuconolactone decarboxylase family protein [Steroidobacteraceae bacterium]